MSANQKIRDRFRRLLKSRWLSVAKHLRCVLDTRLQNGEAVHRLRVAVRRAQATLELMRDWLPVRRTAKASRYLKSVRRQVSEVRDLDVMIRRLVDREASLADECLAAVVVAASCRRSKAARQASRALRRQRYVKRCKRAGRLLVTAVRWRGKGNVPSLLAQLLAEIDRQLESLNKLQNRLVKATLDTHRVRLFCRQLRYILESYAVLRVAVDLKPIVTCLVEIQESLGRSIDARNVLARLRKWAPKVVSSIDAPLLHKSTQAESARLLKRLKQESHRSKQQLARLRHSLSKISKSNRNRAI